jgi:hypothetical protein
MQSLTFAHSSQRVKVLHKYFGGVSNAAPSIGLAILFYAISSTYNFRALQASGPAFFSYFAVAWPLTLFIVGSFIWMFVKSLWGIYNLGKEPVKLKSSFEDSMLGAGPLGSLSLSLTFSNIVFLGVGILLFVTDPFGEFPLTLFGVFVGTLLIGVILFFLPLLNVHKSMVFHKREELRQLREESRNLFSAEGFPRDGNGAIIYLASLERIELGERKMASAATWPFDTSIIGKLIAILLSVTAILLSGYLKNFIPGLH